MLTPTQQKGHIRSVERMNENLYIAHKKIPHKTLRVHTRRRHVLESMKQ